MATPSVSSSTSIRPVVQPSVGGAHPTVPGRDHSGKPLADKDVWDGLKTKKGDRVDTSDGISSEEAEALEELAFEKPAEFLSRLKADSENGTAASFYMHTNGDFFGLKYAVDSKFVANNGRILIEFTVTVSPEEIAKPLRDILADPSKQVNRPLVLKVTTSGALTDDAEIRGLKLDAELNGLPKVSADKLARLNNLMDALLRVFPEGKVITKDMRELLRRVVESGVTRNDGMHIVQVARLLAEQSETFHFEVTSTKRKTHASVDAGEHRIGAQVRDVLDGVWEGLKYPQVDAGARGTLDPQDNDTTEITGAHLSSNPNEKLVMSFEGTRPRLYRIDEDGGRTELQNVFGKILGSLPFSVGALRRS